MMKLKTLIKNKLKIFYSYLLNILLFDLKDKKIEIKMLFSNYTIKNLINIITFINDIFL